MSLNAVARLGPGLPPLSEVVRKAGPHTTELNQRPAVLRRLEKPDRERLLLLHIPQVRLVAKSIWDRARFAVELDDLIGYGMIGLLHALERFDPERGILLKTYAEHRIRGAILDALRGMDWLPRSARQKLHQLELQRREIERIPPSSVSTCKLALPSKTNGGMKSADRKRSPSSLPQMEFVFAGGNLEDLEKLSHQKDRHHFTRSEAWNPESLYERKEAYGRLTDAISRLPRRHREVIELYYHRELNMKQIGHILSVHESRVSQLHSVAIRRLRNDLCEKEESSPAVSKDPGRSYASRPRSRLSKYRVTASQSCSVSTPMVSCAVSAT